MSERVEIEVRKISQQLDELNAKLTDLIAAFTLHTNANTEAINALDRRLRQHLLNHNVMAAGNADA